MTERAKQFVDDLRVVSREHNQRVLIRLLEKGDAWRALDITIDPDGTVRRIPEFIRVKIGVPRDVIERKDKEREVIMDETIAGPNLVLSDEVLSESR